MRFLPARQPPGPGRHRLTLWLVPLLLALVLVDGLLPGRHHQPSTLKLSTPTPPGHLEALVSASAVAAPARRSSATVPTVSANLASRGTLRRLPTSFPGISTESWDVDGLDSDPLALQRVLSFLKVPGDGALMLRVGGQSTEQTYWDAPKLGVGSEAYRPDLAWLKTLARLTRASHLRVLVDLNLVARSPSMAAALAKSLAHYMPARSIAGLEVGNEPDIGHRQVANPLAPPGETVPHTPKGWDQYTSSQYLSLFRSYAKAVHASAPSLRMVGPEVFFAGKNVSWAQQLVNAERSRLSMLTVHRYPLSACASSTAGDYATIARVLGQNASGGMANELVKAVRVAKSAGLPLRLSEFNSVTCGGKTGVSNSFATALWAPDTMFSMWNAGVAGVNIHLAPGQSNAAFSVASSGLTPSPLLYGMILFSRAAGSGARLAPLRTSGTSTPNVKVWAVHGSNNLLRVLILDKGARTVHAALHLGNHGTATVQRLMAPNPSSSTGVTLAGQHLGAQGQWVGRRVMPRIRPVSGTYTVPMPAYSGALITIHL
ncbi:MAG TPA: glycosyl hydrolase family 79 C-terminal domain-containing protein [Solirubrobacteraceae bacterium]|jgi:hypothetical protein|nr:glycosyl hydrolase family 79 C-terminal domain-containing protein [Solirubrobacteraceae bacterium]